MKFLEIYKTLSATSDEQLPQLSTEYTAISVHTIVNFRGWGNPGSGQPGVFSKIRGATRGLGDEPGVFLKHGSLCSNRVCLVFCWVSGGGSPQKKKGSSYAFH